MESLAYAVPKHSPSAL